ncbi:MAG TPA: cytochrome c oxidase subunit II [Caulobacteraceae bacterium]|jgi:cytochrome c oxidase subunit 2|nr:cytochrome c oxidase subunit II [Caulobacteraceae bacterium]
MTPLWPPIASHYAARVDGLIWWYTLVVVLLTAPVFILMAVYAIRYRRGREADRRLKRNSSIVIETSWSVIPFLLTVAFFVYATVLFFNLHNPPANAMTIDVEGKQWMWKFEHPEGQRELNDLHVPAGVPIRLVMTSQDVIHSFYLPALRIKQDVLPGRYTSLWFKADKPGRYRLLCSEFCGTDHSLMGGSIYIMRPDDYARWLRTAGADVSLASRGASLFRSLGCSGCHNGQAGSAAPDLAGLYGKPVPLADGRTIVADDQYIHDKILTPNRDVPAAWPSAMPTYANQVSEDQILELTAYVKSLEGSNGGPRS